MTANTPSPDVVAMMRYDANRKSTLVSYLLWFFLGSFGVHRFYLGRIGTAITMVVCTLLGAVIFVPLLVTGAFLIWDLFAIPSMVRRENRQAAFEAGLPSVF